MHTSALENARAEAVPTAPVSTATSSAAMESPAATGRFCGDLRLRLKGKCLKAKSKAMIAQEPPSDSTALATMLVGALGVGVTAGACASSALKLWLRNRAQEKNGSACASSAANVACASRTADAACASSTADAEAQTEKPWPPPLPEPEDIPSIWISGAGERFHLRRDCRGLRSAHPRTCKTRCLICG
ncbi:unnamed protein product [Polarella glacialis]|uniref:Uncharacterized protein n=1 Tax=Polarella glacialis TaxID=89957 RepID=A0A813GWX0_POLGL|nr:unnamed protein product [Polarella glacialis]